MIDVDHPRGRVRLELLGDDRVDRQHDAALGRLRLPPGSCAPCRPCPSRTSDLPMALPCANRKVLAMPPPMIRTSTFLIRLPSSSSLVETFAPPTIAATGRSGLPSAMRQRLELRLHGAARKGRQLVRDALGRGVGAMGGREGVVDVEVAELGEPFDDRRIVLFLALVEAGVLEQQDVAVLELGDRGLGDCARCSRRRSRPGGSMTLGDGRGDGPQRIGLVRAALGTAEVREQDHLAALVGDLGDGRGDALDARRVGDLAVLGGNVEVDAQEHALAGDVGVVERAEWFGHDRSPSNSSSLGSFRPSSAAGAELRRRVTLRNLRRRAVA